MNYMIFLNDPISLLATIILLITIISLWIKKHPLIWGIGLAFFAGFGLLSTRINLLSIGYFIILFLSIWAYLKTQSKIYKTLAGIIFFVLTIFSLLHQTPGVHNWPYLSNFALSFDSIPLTLYLNYDTPLIGLFFLILGVPLISKKDDWISVLKIVIPTTVALIVVLIPLSYILGYVHFNPKLTNIFFIWAVSNLFFTCITEEIFFRRFLQDLFIENLKKFKYGHYVGILFASILFGIAHFSGGILYIILATISGLFYGWTYYKTQHLEGSILVHFLLNLFHFLLFTYPALITIKV